MTRVECRFGHDASYVVVDVAFCDTCEREVKGYINGADFPFEYCTRCLREKAHKHLGCGKETLRFAQAVSRG